MVALLYKRFCSQRRRSSQLQLQRVGKLLSFPSLAFILYESKGSSHFIFHWGCNLAPRLPWQESRLYQLCYIVNLWIQGSWVLAKLKDQYLPFFFTVWR